MEGGQPWDMNPLIFYRVIGPNQNIHALPVINLTDHFDRKEGSIKLSLMAAHIKPNDILRVEINDEAMMRKVNALKSFTPE